MSVSLRVDPFPPEYALRGLMAAVFAGGGKILPDLARSLGHIGAYEGEKLAGFANIAWDGGQHAFLVDVCVAPSLQGNGIGLQLVHRAIELARERGAGWLHVDFRPEHAGFYARCGFKPTQAGLIDLTS